MPIFKRRGGDEEPAPPDQPAAGHTILSEPDLLRRLGEEIFRATRYERPLAVVCVVPQRLGGELLRREELSAAAAALTQQLRFCDVIGSLNDNTLIAILPETDVVEAGTVAQRIAADLSVRSGAWQLRKWRAGVGRIPDDGTDAASVVRAAIARAAP